MSWKQRIWWFSRWPSAAQATFWLMLGMALYAEWVFLPPSSDLLDQAPHPLVYRVGFASGMAISLFWWLITINIRVRALEAKIEQMINDQKAQ
jgi:hypothetical protein